MDLAAELAARGFGALLVLAEGARDPDLAPFIGSAHLGESLIVARPGAPPALGYLTDMEREEAAATGRRLLTPAELGVPALLAGGARGVELWREVALRALALCDVAPGRLALGGRLGAGLAAGVGEHLRAAGWTIGDGGEVVRRWRKRKSDAELAAIRTAAAGAVAALRAAAALVAAARQRDGELWLEGERLRAGRLRAEIAAVLACHGLEQPHGNVVAIGAAAGVPHSQGDPERVLRAGEALVVDLFPRGRLWADCTRTLCAGTAPEALARAHAAVRAALETAHRGAVAGERGWDLQRAVCRQLGEAGYPTPDTDPGGRTGYVHGLGHGVGYELHEYPSFRRAAGDEGVLDASDVFTLEPGLYDPDAGWGVRLEDLCWLGPLGLENLTPLPYDLDARRWGEPAPAAPRGQRSTQ